MGFLFCCQANLVISYYIYQIRHIIISCSRKTKTKQIKKTKKRKQKKIRLRKKNSSTKEKKIQILRKKRFAKCQTNPKYDSEHQVIKFEKQLKRDGVFLSKKQKYFLSFPHHPLNLKNEKKKKKK